MRARVLAQLRDEGPLSRVQLADRLNVSRPTCACGNTGCLEAFSGGAALARDATAAARPGRSPTSSRPTRWRSTSSRTTPRT